jgi:hypothetical protein
MNVPRAWLAMGGLGLSSLGGGVGRIMTTTSEAKVAGGTGKHRHGSENGDPDIMTDAEKEAASEREKLNLHKGRGYT